jgi:hypothetical protein
MKERNALVIAYADNFLDNKEFVLFTIITNSLILHAFALEF